MKNSIEYQSIRKYYGDDRAERSGIPLINHIDEGLCILGQVGASALAKKAFCLHPIVQQCSALVHNFDTLPTVTDNVQIMALAMEYRRVANAALSARDLTSVNDIRLSPLMDVNDMLIADKVQNYKDFLHAHHGTHPRSDELNHYFQLWLESLGVSQARFKELVVGIHNSECVKQTQ